ncbi:MAG: hypothetical protein IAG10_07765 [Planctomycetaceae bacterium]|nr:hypothetical protein [Planctomycetaceae bacterium]
MRCSMASGLTFVALLFSIAAIGRTDEPEKGKDDELATQRFELMQKRMASVRVKAGEEGFPEQFASKPIFRYTDPARNYVSAAVWKLGEEGRPRALITTELHRQYRGNPRIVYEYLSLTAEKFTVMGGDIRWAPEGTALEFKPVPGTQAPEETPQRRLLQLRAIAKRFAGDELVGKEKCELRLLPQPVDRYTPSSADRADGAIFMVTFGTNPEAALFLESDGKTWSYAVGRLTGASKVALTIDGATAWEGTPVRYGSNQPYNASNAPADIPGIAPDGSEIKD